MKQIILSKENNISIENLMTIANYSLDNINILYTYPLDNNISVYDIIIELCKKITVGGLLNIEVLDLKLAAQHYLSGTIGEQNFLNICKSFYGSPIDITTMKSLLKNQEDVVVKNILQNDYISAITLERRLLP